MQWCDDDDAAPAASPSHRRRGVKRTLSATIDTHSSKSVVATARSASASREPRVNTNPIRVGSDCAGLLTESLALDMLGVKHHHVFMSEVNEHIRHIAYKLHGKNMTVYKDCCNRDLKSVPVVDLYVFGFPCQPFSPAGKGKGLDDPRGLVLGYCLDYVAAKQPRLVIAENSARLASRKFTDTRNMMVHRLEQSGYHVEWAVLNTREQGLPQSRPRFYLVAMRHVVHKFVFPEKIEPVQLAALLEDAKAEPARSSSKTAKGKSRIRAHVNAARLKLESQGLQPEKCNAVLDIGASKAWGHMMVDCSPCLTAQRCMQTGGHFLLRLGRTMTEKEVCRLQGIPDMRIDYAAAGVPKAKFLHAVGNAMSSNVLARVLARALPAVGLWEELPLPTAENMRAKLLHGDDC